MSIGFNDLVVGVFYGSDDKLSGHYKKIKKEYPVIVGAEFWYRLTGEENFYKRLTDAIGEIASEFDGSKHIEEVIDSLAKQIEEELKEQESLEE